MSALLHSAEFWVLVAFVILVAAAFKKVRETMAGALDRRTARIKAQLDEAEKLREDAQSLLADYQRKRKAASDETKTIIEQAKAEAERSRVRAREELERALERRQQLALEQIAQAEAEALKQVRYQAVDLALAATARLMAEHLGREEAGRLVDEAIGELPNKLH